MRRSKELQNVITALTAQAAKGPLDKKDETILVEAQFKLADEFEQEITALLKGADDTACFFALEDAMLALIRDRWSMQDAQEFALMMDEFLEEWQFGQAAVLLKRKTKHGITVN